MATITGKISFLLALFSFCQRPGLPAGVPVSCGVVVAHVHQRGIGYGSDHGQLKNHLQKLSLRHIQLNSFAYQYGVRTAEVRWNDPTLTWNDLRREIEYWKKAGYKTMLKPHIWVVPVKGQKDKWRNAISFNSKQEQAAWFSSYKNFLLQQLAGLKGSLPDWFVIGCELESLSAYQNEWHDLIQAIRKQYPNLQLGYAALSHELEKVRFWDNLDFVGLNFYPKHEDPDPDAGELALHYNAQLQSHASFARSIGKKLVLTEVGFPSHKNAILNSSQWGNAKMKTDVQKQRKGWQALLAAIHAANKSRDIEAFFAWKYVTELKSYEKHDYPFGFILSGKPAEDTIAGYCNGR